MKIKLKFPRILFLTFIFLIINIIPSICLSQPVISIKTDPLKMWGLGESYINVEFTKNISNSALQSQYCCIKANKNKITLFTTEYQLNKNGKLIFDDVIVEGTGLEKLPPPGVDIVDIQIKRKYPHILLIYLSNNKVYSFNIKDFTLSSNGENPSDGSACTKIDGDALYVLTNDHIFVSRNNDKIWEIDSTGLNGCRPTDFTLDSSQYVYAVTNKGYLFKQHPDSSVWRVVSSFPVNTTYSGYITSIFIDRKERIYISTYKDVYVSTDKGITWNKLDDGKPSTQAFKKFGDDAYNNIYAITLDKVYKSSGGTSSWSEIAQSLSEKFLNEAPTFNPNYNNISGDSLLFLSTKYGLFISTDQGSTWIENNEGVETNTVYGFALTANRYLVTTNSGLFFKNINDSSWIKSFPSNGYFNGTRIFHASNGTLFTLGPNKNNSLFSKIPTNWKSTDEGNTWEADTAGLGSISPAQQPVYYADESGVQHYSFYDSPARLYKKESDGQWIADTLGLNALTSDLCTSFGNDKNGNVYAAISRNGIGLIYKRPMTGGTWVLDTAGLKTSQVICINTDETGNLILGTINNGVFKRSGDHWMEFYLPNIYTNYVYALASDTKGTIFASFSNLDGFNFTWKGIYSTTDNGANWKYCGLDSVAIRQMIAYGDTIYIVTYVNGIYTVTRSEEEPSAVKSNTSQMKYTLYQNYPNPFNPETTIKYQIPEEGLVTIKIYDILGREVYTLVNKFQKAGSYDVKFRANNLSSSVYFLSITVNSLSGENKFRDNKKLVLLK